MIVVDTNVTSELMKPSPAAAVAAWVRSKSATDLYTTSITLAEIGYGIERLPRGRRYDELKQAATDVFSAFTEQILAFDTTAATEYVSVVSHRERAGTPINGFDAQIASICRAHRATLATRNVKHFQATGIDVVNPWRHRLGETGAG